MTRPEATAVVAPLIESLPQGGDYPPAQGVPRDAALILLGGERFEKLMASRVRSGGPKPGYIYPWNVIDYMDDATKLG
jgi:hypothetical protein